MDYEAPGGVKRAFARKVTAKDNKRSYIWKDPLMKEVITQAAKDEEYKKVADLVKERKNKHLLKDKLPSDHPARSYLQVWERLGFEEDSIT